MGLTFDEIAGRVGYANRGSAQKAWTRAMDRTGLRDMSLADWQLLEADRLERMAAHIWPAASRGDLAALREWRRLHDAKAKLLGLSIPAGRAERRSQHDQDDDGAANVIGASRLQEMRERRDRDAAARLSTQDPGG